MEKTTTTDVPVREETTTEDDLETTTTFDWTGFDQTTGELISTTETSDIDVDLFDSGSTSETTVESTDFTTTIDYETITDPSVMENGERKNGNMMEGAFNTPKNVSNDIVGGVDSLCSISSMRMNCSIKHIWMIVIGIVILSVILIFILFIRFIKGRGSFDSKHEGVQFVQYYAENTQL